MIRRLKRSLWVSHAAFFLCLIFCSFPQAEEGKIDLAFKDETISALIEGGSLRNIAERIKKERGIWIKGKDTLFDEKVSVEFTDLPLEEGLKRIFSGMNYTFIFDQDGHVMKVMLFGKAERRVRDVRKRRTIQPRKRLPRPLPRRNPRRRPSPG